jgi:hypothetical protein
MNWTRREYDSKGTYHDARLYSLYFRRKRVAKKKVYLRRKYDMRKEMRGLESLSFFGPFFFDGTLIGFFP